MPKSIRIAAALPGLMMLLSGVQWLVDPAAAAQSLGMPLLDGLARSTQVGDFAAFFLATAALIGLGVFQEKRHWFQAAVLLIGGAAVMRTLAWAAHGAEFATQFIAIEAAMAALLLFAASKLPADA